VSNLIRNLALHAVLPSEEGTRREQAFVERALGAIGAEPHDPATTYEPLKHPFALRWTGRMDGQAPAPGHVMLGLLLIGCAAARPRSVRDGPGWAWFVVPFAAFALFCTYLKWQPWHQRLHIPFMALLCPVGAAVLARRRLWIAALPVALLSVGVTSYALLVGDTRRLLPPRSIFQETRAQSFFHHAPHMAEVMTRLEAQLRQLSPRTVALDLLSSNYEYPLLRSIRRRPGASVINLKPSDVAGTGAVSADVMISSTPSDQPPVTRATRQAFHPVLIMGPFTLSLPPTAAREWLAGHPFSGWSQSDGFTDVHGERAITGAAGRLWFDSRGASALLVVEGASGARASVMVRLNGELVAGLAIKDAGGPAIIPLEPRAGRNLLTLTRSPGSEAVAFVRLQLLPTGESIQIPSSALPDPH
jgi:hypothetical protein